MNAPLDPNDTIARIASAIGEAARARMLYSLLDGRARTSSELALVANVNASTASAHLAKLRHEGLVKVVVQGKHRFYSLSNHHVAVLLEKLSVLAGAAKSTFIPTTPARLRSARTCYDHIAGSLGVQLHDRFIALGWLDRVNSGEDAYELTTKGDAGFNKFGVDVADTRGQRRRFAFACLDWSERRPHLGGAIGAAVLSLALQKKWVTREHDDRVLRVTAVGARELARLLGVKIVS